MPPWMMGTGYGQSLPGMGGQMMGGGMMSGKSHMPGTYGQQQPWGQSGWGTGLQLGLGAAGAFGSWWEQKQQREEEKRRYEQARQDEENRRRNMTGAWNAAVGSMGG